MSTEGTPAESTKAVCVKCKSEDIGNFGFCLRCTISERIAEIVPSVLLEPYLDKIGWVRSVRKKVSVDREGGPLPWITYPAIEFLKPRIQPDFHVFEFGSGNSTLWWSARVAKVVACEHDQKWFDRMKDQMPQNVEYLYHELVPGGAYCQAAGAYPGQFDVLVIDGRDRVNCAKNSLTALKPSGVVILDNSDRKRYAEGCAFLVENGFRRLDFNGLSPINIVGTITTVFYRPSNCIGV